MKNLPTSSPSAGFLAASFLTVMTLCTLAAGQSGADPDDLAVVGDRELEIVIGPDPVLPPARIPLSITIDGSDAYLGGTAIPTGNNTWFLDGEFGFAILIAFSDSRVEIHGSEGITTIDSEGMTLHELVDAVADGSGTSQPSLNCSPTEQLCQCSAGPPITCGGLSLQSYKCCSQSAFCGCIPYKSPSGCTLAVKATCLVAPSTE